VRSVRKGSLGGDFGRVGECDVHDKLDLYHISDNPFHPFIISRHFSFLEPTAIYIGHGHGCIFGPS